MPSEKFRQLVAKYFPTSVLPDKVLDAVENDNVTNFSKEYGTTDRTSLAIQYLQEIYQELSKPKPDDAYINLRLKFLEELL